MKKKKKYTGVFSEEASLKFAEELQKTIIPFMEKSIGEGEDNGTFEVIASTSVVDRHGEIILQEGIDTKNYMKNPVILLSHDYWALPIGKATSVELVDGKTIVKGVFASGEANPIAQQVRKLYDAGILKTVSVGIMVKEWEAQTITKCELLELSFVSVPANPEACDIAKGLELDAEFLAKMLVDKTVDDDAKGEEEDEDTKEMKAIKTLVDVVKTLNKNIEDLTVENKNLAVELVEIKSLVTKTVQEGEDAKSKLETSAQMGKMLSQIVSKHNEVLKK
jgi:HK97 family phage prohead protease